MTKIWRYSLLKKYYLEKQNKLGMSKCLYKFIIIQNKIKSEDIFPYYQKQIYELIIE